MSECPRKNRWSFMASGRANTGREGAAAAPTGGAGGSCLKRSSNARAAGALPGAPRRARRARSVAVPPAARAALGSWAAVQRLTGNGTGGPHELLAVRRPSHRVANPPCEANCVVKLDSHAAPGCHQPSAAVARSSTLGSVADSRGGSAGRRGNWLRISSHQVTPRPLPEAEAAALPAMEDSDKTLSGRVNTGEPLAAGPDSLRAWPRLLVLRHTCRPPQPRASPQGDGPPWSTWRSSRASRGTGASGARFPAS